jgi:hypothetical protein
VPFPAHCPVVPHVAADVAAQLPCGSVPAFATPHVPSALPSSLSACVHALQTPAHASLQQSFVSTDALFVSELQKFVSQSAFVLQSLPRVWRLQMSLSTWRPVASDVTPPKSSVRRCDSSNTSPC